MKPGPLSWLRRMWSLAPGPALALLVLAGTAVVGGLPFYAILRSIPDKLLGVCALFRVGTDNKADGLHARVADADAAAEGGRVRLQQPAVLP